MDIELRFSITNERLSWHSLIYFFWCPCGSVSFSGYRKYLCHWQRRKQSEKQLNHASQFSPRSHTLITLRKHAKESSMSMLRSQGLACHRCLWLRCTTSRCRCRPGWAWASASQRRRAEKSQVQRIRPAECPCRQSNLASWGYEEQPSQMRCAHSRWQGASKPEWWHERIGIPARKEWSEAPPGSYQPR